MAFVPNSNDDCGCNDWSQVTANTGIIQLYASQPYLDGSGASPVLTAGANGTTIKSIIIKSQAPNDNGMVRLFVGAAPGLGTCSLIREIPIPVNPALMATPTPPPVLPMLEFDLQMDLKLEAGQFLFASAVNAEPFTIQSTTTIRSLN